MCLDQFLMKPATWEEESKGIILCRFPVKIYHYDLLSCKTLSTIGLHPMLKSLSRQNWCYLLINSTICTSSIHDPSKYVQCKCPWVSTLMTTFIDVKYSRWTKLVKAHRIMEENPWIGFEDLVSISAKTCKKIEMTTVYYHGSHHTWYANLCRYCTC
jgi:hypothetical protein